MRTGYRIGLFIVLPCVAPISGAAGQVLRVEAVALEAPRDAPLRARAVVDVAWDHAWRTARNHDAAWLVLKLRRPNGEYVHARLAGGGHRVAAVPGAESGSATITVAPDGVGLWVHAERPMRGPIRWRLNLALDSASLPQDVGESTLHPFGLEMVFVPEGPFTVGDAGVRAPDYGAFYRVGPDGAPAGPFPIASEVAFDVGARPGALHYRTGEFQGDGEGSVPEAFPKGHRGFYIMKYEVTQGDYAAFLNMLSDDETYERTHFGGRTYIADRGTIRLEGGQYVAGSPTRPMNFLTWDDGLAFADWAGLRPMTELEFTKAARGPEAPVADDFPWGTASRDRLARVIDPLGDFVMTNGWGMERLGDDTRPMFGASFFWVMDLAGGVWERVITIGSPDGRAFRGSHGDGELDGGRADNDDWPHSYAGKSGHGYRGGGYYDAGRSWHEFNPYSPVAYRRFGAWSGGSPHRAYGFRAVRAVP